MILASFGIIAAGQNQTSAGTSQRNVNDDVLSDLKSGDAIPGQYMVEMKDGSVKLVKTKDPDALKNDRDVMTVEQNRVVVATDLDQVKGRNTEAQEVTGNQVTDMQYGDTMVKAPEAWDKLKSENTETVRVAVIDSGIDPTHPDLEGKVLPGTTIINENASGNKYADDGKDDHGHGTHVAGIIAATINNNFGINGISGNVDVELLPVKVLNDSGSGSTYDVVEGIKYAADHGASILNMSLGSNSWSAIEADAVRYAQNKGCLIIAAAGNDSIDVADEYPASYDGVISVGSVTATEERSYFSNYGETLDVSAPGSSIVSTIPKKIAMEQRAQGAAVYGDDKEGYYISWSGTSMATPHVVGVAALYKALHPEVTGADIGSLLMSTARDVGNVGKDIETGSGIVDANAMLGGEVTKVPLKVTAPKGGTELYEEVTLSAMVNPTMDIRTLKYYLDTESDDNLVSTVDCSDGGMYYDCK